MGRPTTPRGSPRSSEEDAAAANVTAVVKQLVDKLKVQILYVTGFAWNKSFDGIAYVSQSLSMYASLQQGHIRA